jgi:pyruvate kinase
MIAASFIRKASDVQTIREILDANGGERILICSKIENQEGVDNIDSILEVSDLLMVARGDMGVEIPIEQVPAVQKMMIQKCNAAGKPVITATQMLDSMIRNPRPTRAEVSDVANAILDGTDAIMLSGESANGDYPVEAVATMAKIAEETEKQLTYTVAVSTAKSHTPAISGVISRAACNAANELQAEAIISSTQTGATARRISQCRPECPIIAVTPDSVVAKQLAFSWGVYPIVADKMISTDELLEKSVESANGDYPVEAVATMAKIAEEAEKQLTYTVAVSTAKSHTPAISGVISRAACNAASELQAEAIISSTQTGATARRISQCRPECPIIAVTSDAVVAKQLAFSWGVYPIVADKMVSTDEMLEKSVETAKMYEYVKSGDTVVLAAGVPVNEIGATNLLKVSVVK